MIENPGSKVGYFLAGLGIGGVLGIFFAPQSGSDTRRQLATGVQEGKEYAERKARQVREGVEEFVERGKEVAAQQKESICEAVDAGRDTYRRLVSKAL